MDPTCVRNDCLKIDLIKGYLFLVSVNLFIRLSDTQWLEFRIVLLPFHPTATLMVGWNPLGNNTILNSREMSIVVFMKADVP